MFCRYLRPLGITEGVGSMSCEGLHALLECILQIICLWFTKMPMRKRSFSSLTAVCSPTTDLRSSLASQSCIIVTVHYADLTLSPEHSVLTSMYVNARHKGVNNAGEIK